MFCDYKDIRKLIDKPPLWFDEHGVPRYCEFHPDNVSNIYAEEVALLLIECQGCSKKYRVAVSHDRMQNIVRGTEYESYKEYQVDDFAYGDAPCFETDSQCAGSTMTSDTIAILEIWERNSETNLEWRKVEGGIKI